MKPSLAIFFLVALPLLAHGDLRQDSTQGTSTQSLRADSTSPQQVISKQDSLTHLKSETSVTKTLVNSFEEARAWFNNNEGFVAVCLGLIAAAWALFLYRKSHPRTKKEAPPDKRDAKQRYLDHVIFTHEKLPVAGFETNLRVPILLENVFVTLYARLTEIDRVRTEQDFTPRVNPSPDRAVTVPEALKFALDRQFDGVVILGWPGSGKTTLAKYLALCFAGDKAEKNLGLSHKLLPVLFYLREVDPEKPLCENILSSLQKYQLGLDEPFFMSSLREGKAILLLDGLDEVATDEKRAAVSQWIHHQVHRAFPKCPLIVTSRFSGYRGNAVLPGPYLRLEIQDYQLPQVKQFIENWLIAVETRLFEDNKQTRQQARLKADDLYHRIESTPALRDLAVNPLMLQIIALVHRDRNTLPERRVELYKECTDVLLERWDKAKGMEVLLSASEARQLLQPVALWMHSVENRREVSKQELLDFIADKLPRIKRQVDQEQLLRSWQERGGIFKGEGDTYFFHHLSFQEYLTAEEVRNTREVEILVKHFDQPWWREPTLLAMGLTNPPIFADFMRALLRDNRQNGAGVDFMLRCLGETLVKDEAPFVEALRKLRRFDARYRALLALEQIGTEAAKAGVRQALEDLESSSTALARSSGKQAQYDEVKKLAATARTILAKWGEIPLEEKAETISVLVKGKTAVLPARIFSPVELNAEYILIPGAKEKIVFDGTGKSAPDYPLYFAKYPVTNKLYRRFISYLAGKHNDETFANLPFDQFAHSFLANVKGIEGFADHLGKDSKAWARVLRSKYEDDKRFNGEDQPVVGVTWYGAAAYCHWLSMGQGARGKKQEDQGARGEGQSAKSRAHTVETIMQDEKLSFRLPNEAEWEWAAGGGKREYPWGEEPPDETRANFGEKVGQTTPVGAYPAGATPEGLMDMAGNVWEWMENLYGEGAFRKDARAVRGGSWDLTAGLLRCAARISDDPDYVWVNNFGFRVVVSQLSFDTLRL